MGTVILKDITKENYREIIKLSVRDNQKHQVATNAVSLAQAFFEGNGIYKGIYADHEPVGFLMVDVEKKDDGKQEYALWRFMIDKNHQGKGFGKKALDLIINYSKEQTGQEEFYLSCVPGEGSAEGFYENYGFQFTGEVDEGEKVYKINL